MLLFYVIPFDINEGKGMTNIIKIITEIYFDKKYGGPGVFFKENSSKLHIEITSQNGYE
jgi:hypothetical protein